MMLSVFVFRNFKIRRMLVKKIFSHPKLAALKMLCFFSAKHF